MKTYIIDGYNVIKQLPNLEIKTLKDGRDDLYSIIKTKRPQGSLKNKVIIVYDGKPQYKAKISRHENIEVIFSQDEPADELIKRLIKNSNNPHNITLITDDRELKEFAMLYKVNPISVRDFFKRAKIKMDEIHIKEKTKLTLEKQKQITEELLKKWDI